MSTPSIQATTNDLLAKQRAPIAARPSPLLTVVRWELRRAFASRLTWILAVALFGVLLLLLGFSLLQDNYAVAATVHGPHGTLVQHSVEGIVTRNSLFGLAILLPITLVEFALFLPFVTADGVSLDVKRRTHELLMTTALPTRAFVWGRYFASMIVALGTAAVYLLALLVLSVALHLKQADYFPALDLPGALAIWAAVVLPPTILLSSLCFALGALFPRHSNLVKAGAVFAWFMVGLILQAYTFDQVRNILAFAQGNPPAWWLAYQTWQPTNTDAGHLFEEQFLRHLHAILNNATLSNAAVQRQVEALKGQMPDLASFTLAHLVLVVVGLAVVAAVALSFRRFRNVVA